MVRYFYAWIPVVIVGAVCILSLPWLGLIALMVVLAGAVALAWAIVSVPYRAGRAITSHRHGRRGARPRLAAALDVYSYAAPQIKPSAVSISAGSRDGVLGRPIPRQEHLS